MSRPFLVRNSVGNNVIAGCNSDQPEIKSRPWDVSELRKYLEGKATCQPDDSLALPGQ